jgi:hypothetical protein
MDTATLAVVEYIVTHVNVGASEQEARDMFSSCKNMIDVASVLDGYFKSNGLYYNLTDTTIAFETIVAEDYTFLHKLQTLPATLCQRGSDRCLNHLHKMAVDFIATHNVKLSLPEEYTLHGYMQWWWLRCNDLTNNAYKHETYKWIYNTLAQDSAPSFRKIEQAVSAASTYAGRQAGRPTKMSMFV